MSIVTLAPSISRLVLALVALLGAVVSLIVMQPQDDTQIASLRSAPLSTQRLEALISSQIDAEHRPSIEALRIILERDARNERARLFLAYEALEENDVDEFLRFYLPLFNIDRRDASTYAATLAELARNDVVRLSVDDALQNQPYWTTAYLRALLQQTLRPLRDLQSSFAFNESSQSLYLNRLVSDGDPSFAYEAFNDFLKRSSEPTITVPYNLDFVQTAAPAPFNWSVDRTKVEFDAPTGVIASFFGRERPRLLRQIIPLTQQSYRFEATMSGYASHEWGHFVWTLRCLENGDLLFERGPGELNSTKTPFSVEFEVTDPSCSFAGISLEGRAGIFPRSVYANINSVSLITNEELRSNAE